VPRRALGRRAPTFDLERAHAERGCALIAGVDEAGRGALAGPLAVGLVVYPTHLFSEPPDGRLSGVRDSKQLTPRQREKAETAVRAAAQVALTAFVSHRIIDKINVNRATEAGLRKLLRMLPRTPDIILMDGTFSFDVGVPIVPIVGGDSRSMSIASASILAKVARDALLRGLDARYPGYGFHENKGYGTRAHRTAIEMIGPSPVHRLTYDPVRSLREGVVVEHEGSEPRNTTRIAGKGSEPHAD